MAVSASVPPVPPLPKRRHWPPRLTNICVPSRYQMLGTEEKHCSHVAGGVTALQSVGRCGRQTRRHARWHPGGLCRAGVLTSPWETAPAAMRRAAGQGMEAAGAPSEPSRLTDPFSLLR